jgi:alpha-1,6-mannosyltransferase
MRVAEVAEFYSPAGGGVRSYIDRKFAAAAAAGHELFVLAPAAEDGFEPRPAGGVVRVRAPQLPFDANYRMFWQAAPVHRWLDQLRPDLVEASSPWRGAWIAAEWPGPAPRALFVHADPVASYPQRWLAPLASRERIDQVCAGFWSYLRRLTGRFQAVVAGGAWLAERLEGQGVGPVESVPLGVDRSVFSPGLRDPSLRAALLADCGQPESAKLLLGVGRFHPEKRWPMVIAAAARAGAGVPLGLVIVGDGLDRTRVRRAAAARPNVRLLPPIHDRGRLAALLASADALVHGCESETFGLVPAEAAASGLPIVSPDAGGCAQLARVAAAEVYRSGDAGAAADAIRRLFAREPAALRAQAHASAAAIRADSDHFAELFGRYEALARGAAKGCMLAA